MAPGVIQNAETINSSLEIATAHDGKLIDGFEQAKVCPIDHLISSANEDQLAPNGDGTEFVHKKLEKPVRKVTRPKVLKHIESGDYLYDRLYDSTCPRIVSVFLICSV